jgi:hypothetical protein
MLAGMNLPPDPADDRRTVPRHLRDSEHQAAPGTAGAGLRREDVPVRRAARGTVLLLVAGAALGATLPLGVACLAVAVVAGVFASLSFLRR